MKRTGLMAVCLLTLTIASIPLASAHSTYHYKKHVARTKDHWHRTLVVVTAYVVRRDRGCETYVSRTSTGTIATNGTIATDQRVFPSGTRFKVPGYGYGVARDTGNEIHGHHIDVAVLTCQAAWNWGVKHITVYYQLPRNA